MNVNDHGAAFVQRNGRVSPRRANAQGQEHPFTVAVSTREARVTVDRGLVCVTSLATGQTST